MKRLVLRALENLGVNYYGGKVGPDLQDIRTTIARSLGLGLYSYDKLDKPYSDSIWVYASVNAIANNLAKVPLKIMKRGTNEEVTDINNPVVKLFNHPNVLMRGLTFIFLLSVYLDIYGEAMVVLDREDPVAFPTNMYVFSPTKFEPVISKDYDSLVGWIYRKGMEVIPLETFKVRQHKYPNPYDDLRGFSPLEAGKLSVEQDYFAAIFNKNFFKEGVRVSGYISVKDELSDQSFDRLVSQFEERHGGMDKAHKIAVIDNDGKFYESKITQRDMEFINLRRMSRQEIFAIYKVNEVVLGLYNEVQSYEGVKMAHKSFWEEAMLPRIMYMEDFINNEILYSIEQGAYEARFDLATVGALHDDYNTRVSTAKIMVNLGWPINAVNDRLELGMKPVPWGDAWWVPMGMLPVDRVLAEADANLQNLENSSSEESPYEEEDPNASEQKPAATTEPQPSSAADKIAWSRFLAAQTRLEEQIHSKVKKFFFDQRKQILENLFNGKSKLLDIDRETRKLQQILGSSYLLGMRLGAELIKAEYSGEEKAATEPLTIPEITSYARTRLSIIPISMMKTVSKQLEMAVADKGDSKEEMAEAIRAVYNKTLRRVNNVIARTESSSVIVVGRILQMQRLNVRYHRWVSSKIDKARDAHAVFNGMTRAIGKSFSDDFIFRYPGDLSAPSHEIIGCRCITVIASEPEGGYYE